MGLVQKIASKGLLYSFGIAFNRIVPEWLFRCRRYVIFEMKPGQEIEIKQPNQDGLLLKWCESEPDYRSVEKVTYFSRQNQPFQSTACMAAYEDRTVAGFWCAMENFVETELGVKYQLKPSETWLFAAHVDEEYRNRGIHQRILKFMITGLNERGYQDVLLAVNPNNKPSMLAHRKHSAKTLGKVFAIRFLSTAAAFASGPGVSCPKQFTWNAKRQPILVEMTSRSRQDS